LYDLITNQHVGGLVLLRENENISNETDIRATTYGLIQELHRAKWLASQQVVPSPATGISVSPQYVPLLIGTIQEGDSSPYNQILSGVTPLPSLMAVGATWDLDLSRQIGRIMGQDLAGLGFNLYLGPALDVLNTPQADGGSDLGVRSFGGNPYWVRKMGQAYIRGLHEGSSGRMAVIASHFPGRGNADRPAEEDIATVRSSLEELRAVELAPFFSVTGEIPTLDTSVEGLMVSHIRYQGFQGSIRASTRPVSADPAALDMLLKQPEMASWRQNGGLVVSDDLGSPAIRRFYEATSGSFNAPLTQQVVREAFNAGNDLLYINHLVAQEDPDSYTTLVRILQFFAQKYRTDPEFARRVDVSVERVLAAKYRIYPEFDINQVAPETEGPAVIGNSDASLQTVMAVARQSVTLISPEADELPNVLPQPPGARSRMVFLTDVQSLKQCNLCPLQPALKVDSLSNAVLRFYGPRATGQVSHSLMTSYTFEDVWKLLNGTTQEDKDTLEGDLQLAEWVVVSLTRPNPGIPETQAFRRLLSGRPDLLRDKKVVVFAFDAPYYLDATDISRVSAYYGVYSKSEPFVDVAARVLFQELAPTGAMPVSVSGAGYDLARATAPDPNQNIPLSIDTLIPEVDLTITPTLQSTYETTPLIQMYGVDDIIPLRTGLIVDRNGRVVPDGTRVSFQINVVTSSGRFLQQIEKLTVDGIARVTYRIEQAGVIDIYANSGGAKSDIVQLDVRSGESIPTIVMQPTDIPTPTPTPTVTPSLTPAPTMTVTLTVTPTPLPDVAVSGRDWFFMLALALTVSAGVSWLGFRQMVTRWGVRWGLLGLMGGLLGYNYLALDLPGSQELLRKSGTQGVLLVTFLGVSLGLLVGLIWKQIFPGRQDPSERRSATGPRTGPKP
jgi:beta-N-acetylhexosaminidase